MEKQNRKGKQLEYKERTMLGGVYRIRNSANGKFLLQSSADLQGSRNRFLFAQQTDMYPHLKLRSDWQEYGRDAFVFEVLEELEKKKDQTADEFAEDVKTLEELWREKVNGSELY
jgi:hypothetical protein